MQFNQITPNYVVSEQISESDLVAIASAGFKTVICNRPDSEIETDLHAQFIQAEAERLGLHFVSNPISNQTGLTMQNLSVQGDAMQAAKGPVFAYCRSGMRSTMCWAMINAGQLPTDNIIHAAANAGYNLDKMRPQIEAMAARA